jgi:hypothetical protein
MYKQTNIEKIKRNNIKFPFTVKVFSLKLQGPGLLKNPYSNWMGR